MTGSEWLEKKFVEKMLTEQLTDDEVSLLMMMMMMMMLCFIA